MFGYPGNASVCVAATDTFAVGLIISAYPNLKPLHRNAADAVSTLTCGAASLSVLAAGFVDVIPTDCGTSVYVFAANRLGQSYVVRVDSHSGLIVSID